jgi:hypothetical protein
LRRCDPPQLLLPSASPDSNTPERERDEIAKALPDGHEVADLVVVLRKNSLSTLQPVVMV